MEDITSAYQCRFPKPWYGLKPEAQHCDLRMEGRVRQGSTSGHYMRVEESLRHSLWHLLRQTSFELGTRCWLTQMAQASSSETPQMVTQVSRIGSLEKASTFLSIRLEVQMRSQTKTLSELISHPRATLRRCSSSRHRLIQIAWPATNAGITAPSNDHHVSTILFSRHRLRGNWGSDLAKIPNKIAAICEGFVKPDG
jgi:hypothetical protein